MDSTNAGPEGAAGLPAAGARIGRYRVTGMLGGGGMGTVVSASDPELDRTVAIKVLNPDRRRSPTELARMLREAQALARLSHPNVVQVYDVGRYAEGIFIAMELVSGQTLGQWLAEDPPWQEALAMFVQAGRGLAAVHDDGLVHRDFKPANVIIDPSGRAKVADFGLARLADAEPSTQSVEVQSLDSLDSAGGLTETGTVLGTPAYMAPEQLRGVRGDARSDQFAFCVALYAALCGGHPFGVDASTSQRLHRIRARIYAPPTRKPPPRALRAAVVRGLRYEPQERFASMAALLRALEAAAGGRRRVTWALGGGAAAAMIAAATLGGRPPRATRCDADEALGEVWSEATRAEVAETFEHSELPYAGGVFASIAGNLDDYAQRWRRMHQRACEARVHGEPEPALEQCLEVARLHLASLTGVLRGGEAFAIDRAHASFDELPDLQRCEADGGLPVPPAESMEAVGEARRRLALVAAARMAGDYEEARTRMDHALEAVSEADYAPLQTDARWLEGKVYLDLGRFEEAERALLEARAAALASERHDIAGGIAIDLLTTVGIKLGRIEDGNRYRDAAVAETAGDPSRHAAALSTSSYLSMMQGQLAEAERDARKVLDVLDAAKAAPMEYLIPRTNLTPILRRRGKLDEALHNQREVVALAESSYSADHPMTATARNNLANVLYGLGDYAAAEAEHRGVLTLRARILPDDHLDIAESHNNLAVVLRNAGDVEGSRTHNARALEIRERALGAEHPLTIQSRQNLAAADMSLEDYPAAEAQFEDVIERWKSALGEQHPELMNAYRHLAAARRAQGDLDGAEEALRHAVRIAEINADGHPAPVGWLHADLCELALDREAYDEASRLCERAVEFLAEALPPSHPERLDASALQADAALRRGARSEAERIAEAAWTAAQSAPKLRPRTRAQVAFALARASADPERAHTLAQIALEHYRDAGPAGNASAVQAWIDAQP